MSRSLALTALILGYCLTLASCATVKPSPSSDPSGDLSAEEVEDFQARLRATVVKELQEAGRSAMVSDVTITHAHRLADGSIKLAYHLTYDTQDEDSGQVTHQLNAEATITRDIYQDSDLEQIVVWKLGDVTPPEQGLTFHDPLVIKSRKPGGGGAASPDQDPSP